MTKVLTDAQLNSVTRVEQANSIYYTVASATDASKQYTVSPDSEHDGAFRCTCPAGNPPTDDHGFFLYPAMCCWHVRAVKQVHQEWIAAKIAEAQACKRLVTYRRVMNAQPTLYSEQQIAADLYQPQPFSILR